MSRRRVIVHDVDGVLADFVGGFATLANSMFGSPLCKTGDPLWSHWNHPPGLNKEQVSTVWDVIKTDPRFWLNMGRLGTDRERDRLRALAERHEVYFVTSRVGIAVKWQTETWLKLHYAIPNPTVILASRKAEIAAGLQATHAVEDKAENAMCLAWFSPAKSYLLDRPYNTYDPTKIGTDKVRRIYTLDEFYTEVDRGGS